MDIPATGTSYPNLSYIAQSYQKLSGFAMVL